MVDAEITSDLADRTLRLQREPHRPLTQLQRILPRGSHRKSISFHQDDAWLGSLQETQGASLIVAADSQGDPIAGDSPPPGSLTPAMLQSIYGVGTPERESTVAVVVAYDQPEIEADLRVFGREFGLQMCTMQDHCLTKLDQRGGMDYPSTDPAWSMESSLDVEVVHAICGTCRIVLVEADSDRLRDMEAAERTAIASGATVVSNSWGTPEFATEASDDAQYFRASDATLIASAGDAGYAYGPRFPAAGTDVVAVGGTSLQLLPNGTYGGETAWRGTASGCSQYIAKPVWQTDKGCRNRTVNDVAAVADPDDGAAVYNSYGFRGRTGWFKIGGTSLAAQVVAGIFGAAGPMTQPIAASLYGGDLSLRDVTAGTNGSCKPAYLCTASAGYDGPTGLGTPYGWR